MMRTEFLTARQKTNRSFKFGNMKPAGALTGSVLMVSLLDSLGCSPLMNANFYYYILRHLRKSFWCK